MTSTSPLHTDYSIYARELWSLGHGHPIWSPEPSPTYGQIRLGDVGYLLEGDFVFLFNCMREAHDPINKRGVPDDFQPFSPPHSDSIQYRPDNITQRELHSTSLSSLAVSEGESIRCVRVKIVPISLADLSVAQRTNNVRICSSYDTVPVHANVRGLAPPAGQRAQMVSQLRAADQKTHGGAY